MGRAKNDSRSTMLPVWPGLSMLAQCDKNCITDADVIV